MWIYQCETTCAVHQAGPLRDVITEEGSFDKAECRRLQQSEDRAYSCVKLGGPNVIRTLHAQTRPVMKLGGPDVTRTQHAETGPGRAQDRRVTRSGVSQVPGMSPVAVV